MAAKGLSCSGIRGLRALHPCRVGAVALLTSAGGMPSGGRQGNTMPCSSDTSLASGSCSKFLRKSGGRKVSLSV